MRRKGHRIDVNKARELRKAGLTYAQIAAELDASKQGIQFALKKYEDCNNVNLTDGNCIYPNIFKWLNNNNMSKTQLSKLLGISTSNNNVINRKLRGESQFKINEIKIILQVSGDTFEHMFATVYDLEEDMQRAVTASVVNSLATDHDVTSVLT